MLHTEEGDEASDMQVASLMTDYASLNSASSFEVCS
jgi:hypothetical protein